MRKSFSRAYQSVRNNLPKVSRARGFSTNKRDAKNGGKAKDVKKKLSVMPPKRKPAPQVSKLLEGILEKEFVLFLGKDLTVALSALAKRMAETNNKAKVGSEKGPAKPVDSVPQEIFEILKDLAKMVKKDSVKQTITVLLSESDPQAKESAIVEARQKLVAELGYARVMNYISKTLVKKMEDFFGTGDLPMVDELPFKLIKSLAPKLIIYEGNDRFFEQQFAHENLPLLSITPVDLINKTVDIANYPDPIILKINGDVENPGLVPLSKAEELKAFGLDEKGEPLEGEAGVVFETLKSLAATTPFVFLGCSLNDSEAPAMLMKAIQDTKEEKVASHAALAVEITDGSYKRFESLEVGVEYLVYTPDAEFTQIVEFLASMATSKAKDFNHGLDGKGVISKAFLFAATAPDYILGVAEKEKAAQSISVFTNDLAHLSLVSDEKFTEQVLLPDLKNKLQDSKTTPEYIAKMVEAITAREKIFTDKVLEDTSCVIKVMAPKKTVLEDLSRSGDDFAISKYEKIVDTIAASHGQFQLKFVDDERRIASDFEVLFVKREGEQYADVCLVADTEMPHFAVNWFGVNTNEGEEKVLLYERYWSVAMSEKDSVEYLKEMIEAAKTGKIAKKEEVKKVEEETKKVEETEKKEKRERRRLFSKPRENNKDGKSQQGSKNSRQKATTKKEEPKKVEEPKKEETPKKAETKKETPKKAEAKKADTPKKEEVKPVEPKKEEVKPVEPKKEEVKPVEPKKKEVKAEEKKAEATQAPVKAEVKNEETPKTEEKKEEVKADEKQKSKFGNFLGGLTSKKMKKEKKEEGKKEDAPKVEEVKPEEAKKEEAPKEEKKVEDVKPVEAPKEEKKVEQAKPEEAKTTEVAPMVQKELTPEEVAKKEKMKKEHQNLHVITETPKADAKKDTPKKKDTKNGAKKDAPKKDTKKDGKKEGAKKTEAKAEVKKDAPKADETKKEQPKAETKKKAEPKAVETKKAEPKTAETKKAEPKAAETKKAEPKAAETKKAEPKAAETKKVEPKTADVKKEEPKTVEAVKETPKVEEKKEEVAEEKKDEPKTEDPKKEEKKTKKGGGFFGLSVKRPGKKTKATEKVEEVKEVVAEKKEEVKEATTA